VLLNADVSYKVARDFVGGAQRASAPCLESITPGQQVVKIITWKLVALLGIGAGPLRRCPPVVLVAGLQGSGRRRFAGGCHRRGGGTLAGGGRSIGPAADQLVSLGGAISIGVHAPGPARSNRAEVEHGRLNARDVVIVDTARRLRGQRDDKVEAIKATSSPEILFVVGDDGQDTINATQAFPSASVRQLSLKMDGDTRGAPRCRCARRQEAD
jgi:signal recognition particle subunit SRP54